jgi:O-antigen/teichoic acid export membrane protein
MSINLEKSDVAWSYVGVITSMSVNVLMLPFIIYFLDGEMLGLWYVFTSIGGLTTLFDFGFSVTFARNVTYCWSGAERLERESVVFSERDEPNYSLLKKILATCRYIYLAISSIALVLLFAAGTPYILYISSGIEGHSHIVAWTIYCIAIFLNLYYGYFSVFLRGVGAVGQANKNTVIARLAQIAVMIVLLFSGFGIIGACAAYLVYGTTFRVLGKRAFFRYESIGERLSQVKEKTTKEESVELFKIVWHNAWRDGLVSLSNYLCNQASTIICSLFLSLTVTGVYSLGVQIATAVATVASTRYTAYQPKLQNAYITQDQEEMQRVMSLIVGMFLCLFVLGTILIAVAGLPLLALVKPESVVPVDIYLVLSVYQLIIGYRNCYTSYFSCTNRILYVWAFLASSAACICLQLLFVGVFKWDIMGLVAGQIISQMAFNVWYWPIKAHREMHYGVGQAVSMYFGEMKHRLVKNR